MTMKDQLSNSASRYAATTTDERVMDAVEELDELYRHQKVEGYHAKFRHFLIKNYTMMRDALTAATYPKQAEKTVDDAELMDAVKHLKGVHTKACNSTKDINSTAKTLQSIDILIRAATSPKQDDIADRLAVDLDAAHDMIRCLIPLAKGYVAANSGIRSTECIIEDAEAMKAAYEKQKGRW